MDLLNPPPPQPPNPWPIRILIAAAVLFIVAATLFYQFRYYQEVSTAERFMDALVAGDYQEAHRIWQPTASYTLGDFLQDWGDTSTWGRIQSYEIVDVQGSGNRAVRFPDEFTGRTRTIDLSGSFSGVLIGIRINERLEPEYIWVEKKDQSLSFPPF